MKAMYKSELARAAGVSDATFRRWLSHHRETLQKMGNPPRAKIVNPAGVKFICENYAIDLA